jgi:hypothetical protein
MKTMRRYAQRTGNLKATVTARTGILERRGFINSSFHIDVERINSSETDSRALMCIERHNRRAGERGLPPR